MGSFNFYAIRNGRENGIVNSWDECAERTQGYSGAEYKGFDDEQRAKAWLNGGNTPTEREQENSSLHYKLPPASNGTAELHIREDEDETAWFAVHEGEIVASGIEQDNLINGTDVMVKFIQKVALRTYEYRGRVVRREQGEITDEMREKISPDSSEEISAEEVNGLCEEVTEKTQGWDDWRVFARSGLNVVVGDPEGPGAKLKEEEGEFVLELFQFQTMSRRATYNLSSKEEVLAKLNEQFGGADDGADDEADEDNREGGCRKCGGTGYIPAYSHVAGGVCFRCDGSGKAPVHA